MQRHYDEYQDACDSDAHHRSLALTLPRAAVYTDLSERLSV